MLMTIGVNPTPIPSTPIHTQVKLDIPMPNPLKFRSKPTHNKKKQTQPKPPTQRWMRFITTWYSQGTITKSGKPVQQGITCAVDPNLIPLGSTIEVKFPNGQTHIYTATDTGGFIKGRHVDIYLDSYRQCILNGVQHVMVRIIPAR